MTPYRRRLVGLPLQRSIFVGIYQAAEVAGLGDALPERRLAAWLDEDGDLFLDRSHVELLQRALLNRASAPFLEHLERALDRSCERLTRVTERDPPLDDSAVPARLAVLGAALRALVPFGILTKFLLDPLFQLLASTTGETEAPLPGRSSGATLTCALLALARECTALGWPPERLEQDWPDVAPEVAGCIRGFCRAQAGFGPLAWDAPGYEDARTVVRALGATAGNDPRALESRLAAPARRPRSLPPKEPSELGETAHRCLARWLDFLEWETWLVRRAFYVGMRPLLCRIAAAQRRVAPIFAPADLLFLELDELSAPVIDVCAASERRERYLADTAYLERYDVDPGRLHALLEL